MYSDAVRQVMEAGTIETERNAAAGSCVFETWKEWRPSNISHHGKICCEIAREWITATDFSGMAGGDVLSGPRWLRQTFKWGGSTYPIFWCEAVRRKKLDCGALAAMAHEVFAARGVKSLRGQLVQRFSRAATEAWRQEWRESGASMKWVDNDLIYHEGCAVVARRNEIKVWDASAGWWIDPRIGDGYGSLLAIRLAGPADAPAFQWGPHTIVPDTWHELR